MSRFRIEVNDYAQVINGDLQTVWSLSLFGTDNNATQRQISLRAPTGSASFTANTILQLPPNVGSSGQFLRTNGSNPATLTWATVTESAQVFTQSATNIFGGTGAGASLTEENTDNFLAGNNAGGDLATGNGNICIGNGTLQSTPGTSNNIAIGVSALGTTTSEGNSGNVAIGYNSMGSANVSGSNNTVVGTNSGIAITSGSSNSILGINAGNSITSGDSNVIIGTNSSVAASISNCIAIGNSPTAAAGGCISIGYISAATAANAISIGQSVAANGAGSIAIGNSASVGNFADAIAIGSSITANQVGGFFVKHRAGVAGNTAGFVGGGNELVDTVSSKRFKTDIRYYVPEYKNFEKIRPVIYKPKEGYGATQNDTNDYIGFIAEEIYDIFPEYVVKNDKGEIHSVLYDKITVLLTSMIQKHEKEILELKERINKLENKL